MGGLYFCMIRCNTGQKCQYSWASMRSTREPEVKFCPQCQQVVHWVENHEALTKAAQKNLCIAFEPAKVMSVVGKKTAAPLPAKQFIVLDQQKLSMKQLNHLKRYLHPDWSLRQLRDAYHNQAGIVKFDGSFAEADQIVEALTNVAIKLVVKREEVLSD